MVFVEELFDIKQQELKYKILDRSMKFGKTVYHQIQATKDFGNVKAGDLGGWVEDAKCLSQTGKCWICPQSFIDRNARVKGNAQIVNSSIENFGIVSGNAVVINSRVRGHGKIGDKARVSDSLVSHQGSVYGNAVLNNTSIVSDNAIVCDDASLDMTTAEDNVIVEGNASVLYSTLRNRARISDNARVFNSTVCDKAKVYGDAKVYEKTELHGASQIYGNTSVFSVVLEDKAKIYGNARVVSEFLETPALIMRDNAEICGSTDISRIFVMQNQNPFVIKGDVVLDNVFAEGTPMLKVALEKEEVKQMQKKYEDIKAKDAKRAKRLKIRMKATKDLDNER